jgi:hypothetical protein
MPFPCNLESTAEYPIKLVVDLVSGFFPFVFWKSADLAKRPAFVRLCTDEERERGLDWSKADEERDAAFGIATEAFGLGLGFCLGFGLISEVFSSLFSSAS